MYMFYQLNEYNKHLLSACWDEDFLLTEYDVSQYLSRIEGSPPKKEPQLNHEGKMKKELGVRIDSGRDKINNEAFPILADALLLIK